MLRLLGLLTLGNLLFGGRRPHRALRRGLLLGALLGFLADRDSANRATENARRAAREAENAARDAMRAARREIRDLRIAERDARKAEREERIAEHLREVHAGIEARRAEREQRRAEFAKEVRTEPFSGTYEVEQIREMENSLARNAQAAALLASVPTIDFPEEDERYHSAEKHRYA